MTIALLCHRAGVGNKLFEIACAYSLSKRLKRELFILPYNLDDPHENKSCKSWVIKRCNVMTSKINETVQHYIQNLININNYKLLMENEHSACCIDTELLYTVSKFDNVILHGFFQDFRYFHEFREDILSLFKCPENVQNNLRDFNTNSYFIHVRLGDYLSHTHHFVDLSNYYDTCLSQIFEKEPEVFVHLFTNDVNTVYEVYPMLQKYKLNMVDETSQVHCLYMMASCKKGGICANSTFSWWGSYLNDNPDKQVYMPSQWFNPHKHLAHVNTSGLYYDGVRIVEV